MKKQLHRIMAICLTVLMCPVSTLGSVGMAADSGKFQSEKLNNLQFLPAYSLGEPLQSVGIRGCAVNNYEGVNYLYTVTSGSTPKFNVYNLDTKTLEEVHRVNGSCAYSHLIAPNGDVYFATQDPAILYRYSPKEKEVENLGTIMGQGAAYDISMDEEENLYVGVWPGGTAVKYSIKTGEFSMYKAPRADNKYYRALGYYDGYIYGGTYGGAGEIYRIDVKSGDTTKIEWPDREEAKTITGVYEMGMMNEFNAIIAERADKSYIMLFYDCKNQCFTEDIILNPANFHTTPELDGKAYFCAGGKLHEMDAATGKVTNTGVSMSFGNRRGAWVDLNEPGYEGKTFVTIAWSGKPVIFNPATMQYRTMTEVNLEGSGIQVHQLGVNPYFNKIYVSGFVAGESAVYDPKTDIFDIFPNGQTENFGGNSKYMYSGNYGKGEILQATNNEPGTPPENRSLFKIEHNQDRPWAVEATEDDWVFFGTVPDYGKAGGALTIYNEKTNKYEVIEKILGDQSIVGLAYKDGKVYGSGSLSPGLGGTVTSTEATMFVYDLETKEKKEFLPDFPADMVPSGIMQIGDLQTGPDGLIWGAVRSYIFALDPDTLEIKKQLLLKPFTWFRNSQYWRPIPMQFGKDGLLYVGNEGIFVVDTETMEFINLQQYHGAQGYAMAVDNDGNVYTSSGDANVLKVTAISDPIPEEERPAMDELLENSVTLQIGNPTAVASGRPARIDADNAKVVPEVIDDRTLLPVRFVAESLGGTVGWDDATQTVSVEIQDKKIEMTLGSKEMKVNGEVIALDVPAQTKNDRTLLPLRALCEQGLGKEVFWDESGLIVVGDKVAGTDEAIVTNLNRYFRQYLSYDYKQEQNRAEREEAAKGDEKIAKYLLPLKNASFEDGDPGELIPKWGTVSEAGKKVRYEVNDTESSSGKQALYVEDSLTNAAMTVQSDPVAVTPGKKFTVRGDILLEEGQTTFYVRFYDNKMNVLEEGINTISSGLGSWQTSELAGKVPKGAILARVFCGTSNAGTGKAYYDNIRFYQYDNQLK